MNPAARELYASIAVALARVGEARVSDKGIHEARKALSLSTGNGLPPLSRNCAQTNPS